MRQNLEDLNRPADGFRGNFKMNGSVKMIDSLVEQLNNAKLDGNTGRYLSVLVQ